MSESAFLEPIADPRRGFLWAGAAPVAAGSGRVGVGVGGGWVATWEGVQALGAGAELDLAWAPTRRGALTATVGAGVGRLTGEEARGLGAVVSGRWLVLDDERARIAPFVAVAGGTTDTAGAVIAGGGVAAEIPFYSVVFDVSLPVGGVVVAGSLPDVPLTPGPFAPLFVLTEAGFSWRLGSSSSFRLGYLAAATTWSWRWHRGPLTVEVSAYTNLLTGNLSARAGWAW